MIRFAASGFWYRGMKEEEKIRRAAAAGFRGLESLAWLGNDPASVRRTLDECGVQSTAVVLQSADPAVNAAVGQRHGMVWAEALPAHEQAFRETLAYMKQTGASILAAVPGMARDDISRAEQRENTVRTLRRLAAMAEGEGVLIALEPLNVLVDHKGQFLSGTAEGVSIVEEVGSPALRLLYDVYHQQITEGNLTETIRAHIGQIGHLHLADVPGRLEPGTGEINYPNVLSAIRSAGYDGWISFECFCSTDCEDVGRRMRALTEPFEG